MNEKTSHLTSDSLSQIKGASVDFSGGSVVKNPLEMQETQVQSPGLEDPLEKEMATHSSVLAWEIPWTEEPGGLQSVELQRVEHDWVTKRQPQNLSFRKSQNALFSQEME